MKKIISIVTCCFVALGLCFALSGCFALKTKNEEASGKAKLAADMIRISGAVCYYDNGNEVTIPDENFEIFVPGYGSVATDMFTFSYKNNVNVYDDSVVVVTAKAENEAVYGSVEIPFDIYPVDKEINSKTELLENYSSTNFRRFLIECDILVDEDETLTFNRSNCYVLFENNSLLTNHGTINFNDVFIVGDTTENSGEIINLGTINISQGAELRLYSSGKLLDKGTVNNLGSINCYGRIYTHDTPIENVDLNGWMGGDMYVRTLITPSSIQLSQTSIEYKDGTTSYTPTITLAGSGDKTVVWENNDHVGTASVSITVGEYHTAFYGPTVSTTFEITPGSVNVTNFEELTSKQQTGNFNRYNINVSSFSTIKAEEEFVLKEGETLNISNTFSIIGSLTNNGTINLNSSYSTNIYISGTFVNNGTLNLTNNQTLRHNSLWIYGTFTNGSAENNTASLAIDKLYTTSGSTFENFGSVQTGLATFGDSVLNGENATLSISDNSTFSGSITNNGTISFPQNKTAEFSKVALANNGTIENNGDMVFDDEFEHFSCTGTFTNLGHIWSYFELDGVSENITVKKRLSDLTVEIEYTEVDYDGLSKRPTFTIIDGENQFLATGGNYSVEYSYTEWNAYQSETDNNKALLKYPGTIHAVLSITNKKFEYGGSYGTESGDVLTYVINRSVFETSNGYSLASALGDKNYSGYRLTGNVSLSAAYTTIYTIAQNQFFDTNGYCLTLSNRVNLSNNGELRLSSGLLVENLSECALVVGGDCTLTNAGTIINSGIIYLTTPQNTISSSGTITNNGKIFVFDNISTEGTGNVYKRKYLPNAKAAESMYLEYSSVLYDETEKEPNVVLSKSVGHLTVEYSNNINPGTATVSVSVTNVLDEMFAGQESFEFTIRRGIKVLSETSYITYSYGTGENIFANENYAVYKLSGDTIISRYTVAQLHENTTLDIGDYSLDMTGFYNHIEIPSSSHIHANVDCSERWAYCIGFADQITLTGNVGEVGEQTTYIYSQTNTTKDHRAFCSWENLFTTATIDLNGFSIEGQLWVNNAYSGKSFTIEITDSSQSHEGRIGSLSGTGYGLRVSSSYDIVVRLSRISVVGCNIEYNGTPSKCNVFAQNCTLSAADDYAVYNGANVTLTNCTVTGATPIYILSKGDTTLSGCTVTANGAFSQTSYTGSAIVYNTYSHYGYLTITDSTRLQSANGAGIEFVIKSGQSRPSQYFAVDTSTTYQIPSGQQQVLRYYA